MVSLILCFLYLSLVLQFVSKFKYLGHITKEFSDDEEKKRKREIRSMFVRCNHYIRRFYKCSKCVKLKLFQFNPVVLSLFLRYSLVDLVQCQRC